MAKKLVEWYQSGDIVTASLKLQPLRPPQTRGEIEAKFQEQHCAVYEGGIQVLLVYKINKFVKFVISLNTQTLRISYTTNLS